MNVSIDEVIRNRDVLVVSGAVGAFGEGSARVLLQFILHMVHRALIRQQELPPAERARVALKVDEAHLLFSATFARMLAMDRSAGLECVAAWQSLGQIEDRDLRSVILNLLRQRMIFAVADADAREMANMLQTAYADVIRDDQPARARMRITPDALMNLPNFHAACSWLVNGSRVPSFIATTLPMTRDDARIERHLERQRQRGAHYPGPLPPPDRLADYLKVPDFVPRKQAHADNGKGERRADPTDAKPGKLSQTGRTSSGAAGPKAPPAKQASAGATGVPPDSSAQAATAGQTPAETATTTDPDRDLALRAPSTPADRAARVGVAPLGSDTGVAVPDSFTELELENPTGLRWENGPRARTSRRSCAPRTSRSSPPCTSCASSTPPRSAGASWQTRRCARSSTGSD